ncbi:MAG: phospholipid carrier-dependent glycosyltransferase [Elusimicrobiota bacterium]
MTERLLAVFSALLVPLAMHLVMLNFGGTMLPGFMGLALLGFIFLTAAGCGRLLLRVLNVGGLSESERTLIGATLGLGLLSQGMFLLGVLGGMKAWAVSALLGVFWVVGFTELRDLLASLVGSLGLLRDRPALAGGTFVCLGALLWLAWVPPHHYDALVYHLPLAAAYVKAGRIFPVEHLLFTHFPQNAEMLYSMALLLGSDLLAQMLTWLATFLSVWWVFEMGKRFLRIGTVLLACLLVVTHTSVMLLTPTAYVECVVMLWITAAVLSTLRWRSESDEESGPRGWLAMAGIFAGLGVGTKYYAGICPALIGFYLLCRWLASAFGGPHSAFARERLKDGFVFAGTAVLAGAPWLVKNVVFVGNPVFPFLYRFFPLRGVEWSAMSAQRYFEIMTEYGIPEGRFWSELLRFPYLAASGSTRFGGGADVLGGLGWAPLFVSVPLALWAAWRKRPMRWLLAYCLGHWLLWYNTGVVLRFLVVIVPLASMLAADGLSQAWERMGSAGRVLLGAALAVMLWTNLALFLSVNAMVDSLPVLVGLKTRQQFLSEKLDYYPCAAFARERLDPDDRVLIFGEQRGFYVEQPHTATTVLAPNRFVRMANEAQGPEDLSRRLREEAGFRHVLVVPREAKRLDDGYGVLHFTERGLANWAALEQGWVEPVFEAPGRCSLYRMR